MYTIITADPRLATLYELQTVYSVADVYDMLEVLEANSTLRDEYEKASRQ